MGNGLVLFGDVFSRYSSLSVTSENTDYPKENLDSKNPRKYCKASATGTQNITIDMGSGWAKAMKAGLILNTNIGSGDTKNFQASSDDFTTIHETEAMTLDSRTFEYDGYTYTRKALFKSGLSWSAYRYLRFNLAITGDYVEVARPCLFTDQYEFGINYEWGYSAGEETHFIDTPGGKGMVFSELDFGRWRADLYFRGIEDDQIDEINQKLKYQPYVAFLPEGITGHVYLGTMRFNLPSHKYFENWGVGATFIELPYEGKQS